MVTPGFFNMTLIVEQILIYGIVLGVCGLIVWIYLKRHRKETQETLRKVDLAKEEGLHEPVSLHPFIDLKTCIGSAACIVDCPEKDILGMVDGKVTVVNASECVGHGACFHACPVEAISLRIGTETRGVDLPHVSESFETNMKGIYIAGELGGMGLIKNSVEQGQQAMESIIKSSKPKKEGVLDAVIVGAGPAGISATLTAKKHGLKTMTVEQESLGGTVYTYPRAKVVMTSPMDLPLYGKVKLRTTNKDELLKVWNDAINKNNLTIRENTKVDSIVPIADDILKVKIEGGEEVLTNHVLLATGRRGSPRKLEIPGENKQKVAYRCLEPERISGKRIVVVGGGDSAIESTLLLMMDNEVLLSYRKDKFSRLKPKNREKILNAIEEKKIEMCYNSNVVSIDDEFILLKEGEYTRQIQNDLVYIFAGGELPAKFLQQVGVEITRRFGFIMKKHE